MDLTPDLTAGLTADPTADRAPDLTPPFALIRAEGSNTLELLRGNVVDVERLADLPDAAQLVLVPYRQLRERGDACHDDGTPLRTLLIESRTRVEQGDLPQFPRPVLRDGAFDIDDDAYARQVKTVLDEEIGTGEGANFVLRRTFVGYCDDTLAAAFGALHDLLSRERGAYWTFLVHTGDRIMVGATPERHVSLVDGVAMMNPISGTLRRPPRRTTREQMTAFLADPKERDELAMVVDEELKMLAAVGDLGGRVTGPYLKEMANLAHTEYYIEARTTLDARQILRETMFAPTATGSPIRNAFRVIARHETTGRGYYAGVAALIGRDSAGRQTMEAPLLLRVAYLDPADGSVRVPVGATLVRGSDPYDEVRETHAKAAGVLRAFGVGEAAGEAGESGKIGESGAATSLDNAARGILEAEGPVWATDPEVLASLAARNEHLAPFWLREHESNALVVPELAGKSVLIVDNEDAFTAMQVVLLRALGLDVAVVPYTDAMDIVMDTGMDTSAATAGSRSDLVILGPGPGDPRDATSAKSRVNRAILARLLDEGRPVLGICLGHQFLCAELGLELVNKTLPNQGTQIAVDHFGRTTRVGFYNSFAALAPTAAPIEATGRPGTAGSLLVSRDGPEIAAMRGVHRGSLFAGLQFHPESVLSVDGIDILRDEVTRLLGTVHSPTPTRPR